MLKKTTFGIGINALEGSKNDYERILVVGDIHGCYNMLTKLLERIKLTDKDLLVFCGDYIDRGPEPLKCLLKVMELADDPNLNVVALMGNHEWNLAWIGKTMGFNFLTNAENLKMLNSSSDGNISTYKDLLRYKIAGNSIKDLINKMVNMPVMLKLDDDTYIAHAGYDVEKGLDNCEIDDCIEVREEFFSKYRGAANWYIGHTPTPYIAQLFNMDYNTIYPIVKGKNGKITFLDTAAFWVNGYLSCVDIKRNKLYRISH